MKIWFNNTEETLDLSTLLDLLIYKGLENKPGIAVAHNNSVIQKVNWSKILLNENDKILVITATQGG